MSIKLFVVDDSPVMRQVLTEIVSRDQKIELIGSAPDPLIAQKKMEKNWPDVILLDVEMPKMDGIKFLKKIMSERPTPVVMCSALTTQGANLSLEAMASGAIDVIAKPQKGVSGMLEFEFCNKITNTIRTAANASVKQLKYLNEQSYRIKQSVDCLLPSQPSRHIRKTETMIAVGASTGGTEAISVLLSGFRPPCPAILVVQHMPEHFTRAFADRLDASSPLKVVEAENDMPLMPSCVYIAPGGKHMLINRFTDHYKIAIKDGPLINRHKPSVDALFRSIAQNAGANAIGVILTGMGDDGAQGLLEMKKTGATTFAESEQSCVVFGMPKEAIAKGAVDYVSSLDHLATNILNKMESSHG